ETGKRKAALNYAEVVHCLAFSADGKSLFTGSADQTLRRWDVATGRELAVFEGHRREVRAAAVTADGKTAATFSGDGTVRVWDVATAKEIGKWEASDTRIDERLDFPRSLAFADGGKKLLLLSDRSTLVWDAATGQELR